jgi:serine/threonine-protein phosphatase 2A activator
MSDFIEDQDSNLLPELTYTSLNQGESSTENDKSDTTTIGDERRIRHFSKPVKAINNQLDFDKFSKSTTYTEILDFVKLCAESVVDVPNLSDTIPLSPFVTKFVTFMGDLYELVNKVPPMKQPMRFGNKSFRVWHEQMMTDVLPTFLLDVYLPTDFSELATELIPYLGDMFGNATRIDYGK